MDRKEVRKRVTESVATETQDEIRQAWQRFAIITLSLFALILLGIVIFMIQRGFGSADPVDESVSQGMTIEDMQAAATETAKGFLKAESVPSRARFVVDPRRVMPLMERHYQRRPWTEKRFKDFLAPQLHVASDREFLMGKVLFEDGTDAFWVFEKSDEDELKLQWEVAVAYAEKDWDTFIEERDTEGGLFRVTMEYLVDEPYFNHDFRDDELFDCFMLRVPYSEKYLYGYLDKESQAYKSFVAVRLLSNLVSMPVIAKLRFPQNAHGEQVLIEDIKAFSWVEGVDM